MRTERMEYTFKACTFRENFKPQSFNVSACMIQVSERRVKVRKSWIERMIPVKVCSQPLDKTGVDHYLSRSCICELPVHIQEERREHLKYFWWCFCWRGPEV